MEHEWDKIIQEAIQWGDKKHNYQANIHFERIDLQQFLCSQWETKLITEY